ncbi:MAG TPA: class I SAM-dependent methyltransferase [Chthoniobacterales bacterium]|nr:class I SAM-dependent methyltransferase [Chthoniobacterales bacterium]
MRRAMGKPDYEWIAAGEEWSEPWGGSAGQWFGSILPRIQGALSAKTILEIGSGFGRWSHYLREHCTQLYLVDPDTRCMQACQERFATDSKVRFYRNEGDSLAGIADNSVDFIFSFDSLVHVQRQTIETYLSQFAAKLTPSGLGFIHHSNLGEYASSLARRVRTLRGKGMASDHQRDPEMTAGLFRQLAEQYGLQCLCQELVNWRGRRLIDCFSMIAPGESKRKAATRPLRNHDFMLEAQLIRRITQHYPKASAAS